MSGPRYQRTKEQDQRLVAYECPDCGWVSFPEKRHTCQRCGGIEPGFEEVQLAERGEVLTYVVQEYLPEEFETPMPLAMIDVPQADGDGEPARVYGLLTETSIDELEVGTEVEARFREIFADGDRPINSFKFGVPREEKR